MNVIKWALALIIGLSGLQAQGLSNTDIKTFTLLPTTIPANGPVVFERASDVFDAFKESYRDFTPRYVQITGQDKLWHLQRQVQTTSKKKPVVIYSRGFRGKFEALISRNFNYGHSFIALYKYIQIGLIHSPAIGFDYLDLWNNFDHGGAKRVEQLDFVLRQSQNKESDIILMGDCIGAKTIIKLTDVNTYNQVKALVLEAPGLDFEVMTRNIAKNKFNYAKKGSDRLCYAFTHLLPRYDKNSDDTLAAAKLIPTHIPIFLAHLYNDQMIRNEEMQELVQTLRDSGHTVYFLVVDYPLVTHSHIAVTEPYRKALNAFYKKYELPYDPQLAQNGNVILERAAQNAQSATIEHIESAA